MTDEKFCFISDLRERKSLVASAKKQKNGSKSQKCSLSTDGKSEKELAERNGECRSLKLNVPHFYRNISYYGPELVQEYITGIMNRYSVSFRTVCAMMRTSTDGLGKFLQGAGYPVKTAELELTVESVEKWNTWLSANNWNYGRIPADLTTETTHADTLDLDRPYTATELARFKPADVRAYLQLLIDQYAVPAFRLKVMTGATSINALNSLAGEGNTLDDYSNGECTRDQQLAWNAWLEKYSWGNGKYKHCKSVSKTNDAQETEQEETTTGVKEDENMAEKNPEAVPMVNDLSLTVSITSKDQLEATFNMIRAMYLSGGLTINVKSAPTT